MESKSIVIRGNEDQSEDCFSSENKEGNPEMIKTMNSNEFENQEKTRETSRLNQNASENRIVDYFSIPDADKSIEQSKKPIYYNITQEESDYYTKENSRNFVKFRTLRIPILLLNPKDYEKSKKDFFEDIFNNIVFWTQNRSANENLENKNLFENDKKARLLSKSGNNAYKSKTNFRFLTNSNYGIKFPKK